MPDAAGRCSQISNVAEPPRAPGPHEHPAGESPARDSAPREWAGRGLKNGLSKVVVCTSSFELRVDFLPVERVFKIGSPKEVAHSTKRAGRSGHAPCLSSRVTIVPTHALELIEAAAARIAVDKRQIENCDTPQKPFVVLVQHLVTIAIGGGFHAHGLYDEPLQTYPYRDLTHQGFDWVMGFVEGGGRRRHLRRTKIRAVQPLLELQQK